MQRSKMRSVSIFVVSVVIGILLASAFYGFTSAQTEEPEMWGFGDLTSGGIIVVLSMDIGDVDTAELMVESFAETMVDEILEPGYTEVDFVWTADEKASTLKTDEVNCRMFFGDSVSDTGETLVVMCQDGSNIIAITSTDDSEEVLFTLIDDMYQEGEPEVPDNYTDMTDMLN